MKRYHYKEEVSHQIEKDIWIYISNQWLISRTYKEILQIHKEKNKSIFKNWTKNPEYFKKSKLPNKHMKRCLALFIIRKMRYHYIITFFNDNT